MGTQVGQLCGLDLNIELLEDLEEFGFFGNFRHWGKEDAGVVAGFLVGVG